MGARRERAPPGSSRDRPLAPLTKVRTGGAGRRSTRRRARQEALVESLRWAQDQGHAVGLIGSGSNLLVADDGFHGLAIKLEGDLAAFERDGERVLAGGAARLPSVAAKTAGWGLSGLEFGVNIPGTVGGSVRMNANAYGGQLARVLEWVEITTAAGTARRAPGELGFVYRNSNLARGRSRQPRQLPAALSGPGGDPGDAGDDAGAPARGPALGDQDLRLDLQEPRGRARRGPHRRAAARRRRLPRPRRRRRPLLAEKHANFVENFDDATTADVVALMAEGRRRVHERTGVELEPEVQVLGEVSWPGGWEL